MTELKPCPFCGGEDLDVHVGVSVGRRHECVTITCNDCVGSIYGGTEERAIEKWNSRYHSEFEETVIKAWKEIKDYTERTCRMELTDLSSGSAYHDVWLCSLCGEQVEQHTVMGKSMPPNFCPNCGAKVVGE